MVICMVCNTEVVDGIICERCSAPKHQDCHEYSPACSRYGCIGTERQTQDLDGNAEITLMSIIGGIGFALYLTDGPKQGLYVLSAIGLGGLCGLLVCYAKEYLKGSMHSKNASFKTTYLLPEDRKQIDCREQKMLEQRLMSDL